VDDRRSRAASSLIRGPEGIGGLVWSSVSPIAHAFFPRFYRLVRLFEPAMGPLWRRTGIGNTVVVVTVGRRTGTPRCVYLGLLRVADSVYVGHPDFTCGWTRNLDAEARGELRFADGHAETFRAVRLEPGSERDAVIRATFGQQPFPGNVVYWLFRRHIREVGRFYRLEDRAPVG
jgi:hypothetical protein